MDYTATEMMTIAAARALKSEDVCFVGIGAPSVACNLARLTHAPGITLIYESGVIGARPQALPLSIGDSELSETALTTVSIPEIFQYWLQGGRMSIGFLGGAQIDRYGNINSTVIGAYDHPNVRLPGAGGAPEIASACGQIYIIMSQNRRAFVERVDFITSFGHGTGHDARQRLGLRTLGPGLVVTDLCLMRPDLDSRELTVMAVHPGVTHKQIAEATGWEIRFARDMISTPVPTEIELHTLRELHKRTARIHAGEDSGATFN